MEGSRRSRKPFSLLLAFVAIDLCGAEVAVPQGAGRLPTVALVECLAEEDSRALGQYCRTSYECSGEAAGVLWEGLENHNGRRVTLETDAIATERDCILNIEDEAAVRFFTGYRPQGKSGDVVGLVRTGTVESANYGLYWRSVVRPNRAAARDDALEGCDSRRSNDAPCTIPRDSGGWESVYSLRHVPCLAVAESDNNASYFQFARNATDAERWAVSRCRMFGGVNCRLGAVQIVDDDGNVTENLGRTASCYEPSAYPDHYRAFAWNSQEIYAATSTQSPQTPALERRTWNSGSANPPSAEAAR